MSDYSNFLELLAFSEDEINEMLPRWKNACKLLGLSERDVRFATEEWIPKYWDMSLLGVRKCIGAYIRELIEMTRLPKYKARGAKILYCNMPSHPACVYANKLAGGDDIHISYPDFLMASVLNAFFHKSTVLSSGESSCMNPMCNHCGMNRLKVDAHYKNLIKAPTVMWNWGLYCNEGPKTEELIQSVGNTEWTYVLTAMPHDVKYGVHEASDEKRIRYLAKELRDSQASVSALTGISVGEEYLRRSTDIYLEYIGKLDELMSLVVNADPQPLSGNDMTLFATLTHTTFDTGYKYITDALETIIEEVRGRVAKGEGPLPKGAPRLACHFLPYCVPWVCGAFAENGINLSTNTYFAPPGTLKKLPREADEYRNIARQWLSNPSAVNMGDEINIVCDIITSTPVDGVLYGFFSFDRWVGGLQKTMIKVVEERTKIPHYYLEGNFWSDEEYSLDDRLARIKSIAFKVKINHTISGISHAKKKDTK